MADFYYTVDTSPMAASIKSMETHVKGTIVAVAAMEASVIAAEKQAEKTITQNIDRGFYSLIKSQISQKAVAAYTEMSSKLLIMQQYIKTLDKIKHQMMADYQMISRRYHKLFQSLNKSAESRIRELDGHIMDIAAVKSDAVMGRQRDDGAAFLTAHNEMLMVSQSALSAKVKLKTKYTIDKLASHIDETNAYTGKLDSIIDSRSDEQQMDELFLPIIISEVDSFIGDTSLEHIYTNTSSAESWSNKTSIVNKVTAINETLEWKAVSGYEKQLTQKEFLALCEQGELDERLSTMMNNLFDKTVWDTLGGRVGDVAPESGLKEDLSETPSEEGEAQDGI